MEPLSFGDPPPLSPVDYSWFSESSTSEDPSHHTEEGFHENILQHLDPILGPKQAERLSGAQEAFPYNLEISNAKGPSPPTPPGLTEVSEPLRSSQSHGAQRSGQDLQEKEATKQLKERVAALEAEVKDLKGQKAAWLERETELVTALSDLAEGRRAEEELREEVERLRASLQAERLRFTEEAEKVARYEAQLETLERTATHASKNLEALVQERASAEEALHAESERRLQTLEKTQEVLFSQKLRSEKEALSFILKEKFEEEKNKELQATICNLSSKFEEDIAQIRADLAAQSKQEIERIKTFYLEANAKLVSESFEQRQLIDQLEETVEAREAQIKELRAKLKRTSLAALVSSNPEDRRELDLLHRRLALQEEEKKELRRQLEARQHGQFLSEGSQLQALVQENRRLKEKEKYLAEVTLREQKQLFQLELRKLQASFEEERKRMAEDARRQNEKEANFSQLRAREQIKGIMENVALMKAEFAAREKRLLEQHAREIQELTDQLSAARKVGWKEAADLSWISSSFPSHHHKARPSSTSSGRLSEPVRLRSERSVFSSGNLTPVSLSSPPLLSPPIQTEDLSRSPAESILRHERGIKNGKERFRVTFS